MWDKVSLYKFQQVESINAKELSDEDKTLFSVCAIFDYTEYELDNLADTKKGMKQFVKMTNKLTKIFSSEFPIKIYTRIGRYIINYDISQLSFGQYVELSYFLSAGHIQNAHYIFASISHFPFVKNNADYHKKKAEYFSKQPVTKIISGLSKLTENFNSFNNEYKTLFGLSKEVNGDVQEDKFNKRYGWIYSASQVAEYERITLEQAFKLPVRQAFNDLAYLKAKGEYESAQLKN